MCGLVGMAGALAFRDEIVMKRLLLFDYFRGPDSTGLASIRLAGTAPDVRIAKMATTPLNLFDNIKFRDALNGNSSRVFLGHNRASTRGAVNDVNAHPFHIDHIVGAHNGTLTLKSTRELEEAVGEKFGVDSAALFAGIARLGLKETLKLLEIGNTGSDGAWSLTWVDLEQQTLNFLRNEHRPMWLAYAADFKHIFWASQWPIMHAAIASDDRPYELYQDKDGNRFFPTDEDIHYVFDLNELKEGVKKPKPKTYKRPGVPIVTTPVTGSYGGGYGMGGTWTPFHRAQMEDTTPSGDGKKGDSIPSPSKQTVTLGVPSTKANSRSETPLPLQLVGDAEEPLGGFISPEHFAEMTKYGCWWCQKPILYDTPGITIIEKCSVVLCPEHTSGVSTKIFAPRAKIEAFEYR